MNKNPATMPAAMKNDTAATVPISFWSLLEELLIMGEDVGIEGLRVCDCSHDVHVLQTMLVPGQISQAVHTV